MNLHGAIIIRTDGVRRKSETKSVRYYVGYSHVHARAGDGVQISVDGTCAYPVREQEQTTNCIWSCRVPVPSVGGPIGRLESEYRNAGAFGGSAELGKIANKSESFEIQNNLN